MSVKKLPSKKGRTLSALGEHVQRVQQAPHIGLDVALHRIGGGSVVILENGAFPVGDELLALLDKSLHGWRYHNALGPRLFPRPPAPLFFGQKMRASLLLLLLLLLALATAQVASPAQYDKMQATLLRRLDGTTGAAFVSNWLALLSPDVVVCYPFVGLVDPLHCRVGLQNVTNAWNPPDQHPQSSTSIEQDSYWLTQYDAATAPVAIWHYTTASAYTPSGQTAACVVQFQGVVTWRLSAVTGLIDMWLETPDTQRLATTYPCKAQPRPLGVQ